eukprot:SAG31_NODE_2276_length_6028_cov_44.362287_4_plen_166_part_00
MRDPAGCRARRSRRGRPRLAAGAAADENRRHDSTPQSLNAAAAHSGCARPPDCAAAPLPNADAASALLFLSGRTRQRVHHCFPARFVREAQPRCVHTVLPPTLARARALTALSRWKGSGHPEQPDRYSQTRDSLFRRFDDSESSGIHRVRWECSPPRATHEQLSR